MAPNGEDATVATSVDGGATAADRRVVVDEIKEGEGEGENVEKAGSFRPILCWRSFFRGGDDDDGTSDDDDDIRVVVVVVVVNKVCGN